MGAYLRQTTVHGFRHLDIRKGSASWTRLAWSMVIPLSFVVSGWIVANSLDDIRRNPESTSIDSVPIQGSVQRERETVNVNCNVVLYKKVQLSWFLGKNIFNFFAKLKACTINNLLCKNVDRQRN